MEELHKNHKEVPFGWALLLEDWRRSRTRRRLRAQRRLEGVPSR
jgi:hypothetical protein